MAESKLDFTDDVIEEIKKLAGDGLSQKDIHEYYGISHSVWYEKIKNRPDIKDIIKQASSKKGAKYADYLTIYIEKGMSSDNAVDKKLGLSALIFYLKTRRGWAEKNLESDESAHQPAQDNNYKIPTTDDPIEAARIYQRIMEK